MAPSKTPGDLGKVGTLDPWSRKKNRSGSAEKRARKVRLTKAVRDCWQTASAEPLKSGASA